MAEEEKKENPEQESEETGDEAEEEVELDEDGNPIPKKKKKKKLLIILVVLVLLIGGGVGAMMSGIIDLGGGEKEEENPDLVSQTMYYDMDEFLVNLNNPGTQVSFLKAIITIEVPNQASLSEAQSKMPRIRDLFQVYLRELRSSDLQGSAGLQRLRAELLLRINSVMDKGKVSNVLFKEIIVQ